MGENVAFPKVSIHIPAYFEPVEMLKQTLDAVSRLDYPNFECVCIINNTPDPEFWQPIQDHCRALGERFKFINAEKVKFSGKKWEQKEYRWYTGYPGQKTVGAATRLERKPELILKEAVRRMLPKNKLAFKMITKLKIYKGSEHPHQAQQPVPLELAAK